MSPCRVKCSTSLVRRTTVRRCGRACTQDVPCQRLTSLESTDVETLWLLYRRQRMPRCLSHVVVGTIYNPPSADDKKMTSHILNCLDTVTRDHPQAGVVVLGDFNRLRDAAIISYPLKQVVKAPTRRAAVLDKIYTNLHDWYNVPVVLPIRPLCCCNVGKCQRKA